MGKRMLDSSDALEASWLDKKANGLGWLDNSEMTHQSHKVKAFDCKHCVSDAERNQENMIASALFAPDGLTPPF